MIERAPAALWKLGPVSGDDMAEWCALLRDDNDIHLQREAAEAAGFGSRRVNPGPANLAYVISAVLAARPQQDFAEVSAFFAGNVFEDDCLTVSIADAENGATAALHAEGREAPVLQVRFTFREDE